MKQCVNRQKANRLVIGICVAMLSVSSIAAQATKGDRVQGFEAERLAVVPFVNTTDVSQWDALGSAMAQTIELTLRLSGQFDVADLEINDPIDPYSPEGTVRLGRIAEDQRLDAAIIGRISALSNGRVELQAAAYSADTGEIIGAETREAFGSFDILDAADELVVIASSAFLGYEVGFGGIIFEPSRPDVAYRIYIDGIDVGTNLASLPQVLTGRRTIEVAAITAQGEQYIYSADRSIRTGEAIEVEFGLPAVTPTEQREISAGHEVATELLGRPEQYLVAFEALQESRQLLMASQSATLDPLRETQSLLEAVWRLEEELYRLGPDDYVGDDGYEIGRPTSVITGTTTIASDTIDSQIQDRMIQDRIARNGAAHYYFLHLLWTEALAAADWDRSEALLNDLEAVVDTYDLPFEGQLRKDRAEWRKAKNESAAYRRRSGRPWPYVGIAVGLGGIGVGTYSIVTDQIGQYESEGDDYYDDYEVATTGVEAERLREQAEDAYDDAEFAEFVQWTSLAVGGVVAALSTWRLIHNRRAERTFLAEWATERYGQEISLSERVFSDDFIEAIGDTPQLEDPDDDGAVEILVLGPPGEVVYIDGQPRVLPFLTKQPVGETFSSDRAPVVDADRTRIFVEEFSIVVLQ